MNPMTITSNNQCFLTFSKKMSTDMEVDGSRDDEALPDRPNGNLDLMKESFKYYKRRKPPPDISGVTDFDHCATGTLLVSMATCVQHIVIIFKGILACCCQCMDVTQLFIPIICWGCRAEDLISDDIMSPAADHTSVEEI